MDSFHGTVLAMLAALCVLAGCAETAEPGPPRPQQAGQPMDPLRVAGHVASIRGSALLGDQEGVQQGLMAMQEDVRKAMKLADPARRVDREEARAALHGMEGLASVVWLDHENLFVPARGLG